MGIELRRVMKSEPAKAFAERMKNIYNEAEAALFKARNNMQCYADFSRGNVPDYKVEDKV